MAGTIYPALLMLPRIFIDTPLAIKQHITLNDSASNHILRVLRLQIAQQLVIFNGKDGEFSGRLVAITKHQARIVLEKHFVRNAESPLQIHLAQGIAKGDKMDFIIQKAVE